MNRKHKILPILLLCNIFSELNESYIYAILLWMPAHFFLERGFGYLLWMEQGEQNMYLYFIMLPHSLCQSMPSVHTHTHTHTHTHAHKYTGIHRKHVICLKLNEQFHYINGRYWNIGAKHCFSARGNNLYVPFPCVSSKCICN